MPAVFHCDAAGGDAGDAGSEGLEHDAAVPPVQEAGSGAAAAELEGEGMTEYEVEVLVKAGPMMMRRQQMMVRTKNARGAIRSALARYEDEPIFQVNVATKAAAESHRRAMMPKEIRT